MQKHAGIRPIVQPAKRGDKSFWMAIAAACAPRAGDGSSASNLVPVSDQDIFIRRAKPKVDQAIGQVVDDISLSPHSQSKPGEEAVCTENLIRGGTRENHLPSGRDDRPDVLLPYS
jgi:hypothetical protein